MGLGGEELENVVDGILETGRKHLIGFVEAEHLDRVGLQCTTADHVEHTSWSPDNNVRSIPELGDIITDSRSANTSVAVDVEVVAQSDDDLLDLLSELTGGSQDQGLSLLDRGVDLLLSANPARLLISQLTLWRIEIVKVAVFPVPD